MDAFHSIKEITTRALKALRRTPDPELELLEAVEAADNWENLVERLDALRTVARRRQQEALERLEPLAAKAEDLMRQAKAARIGVLRRNLLRQAEGYLHELEAVDEPARIHAANVRLLTDVIKQARRAAAMREPVLPGHALDAIAARLEEAVVAYEEASGAARELDDAGRIQIEAEPRLETLESRLAATFGEREAAPDSEPEADVAALEQRLYA